MNWKTRAHFDLILPRLDRQSSPGWPLCREATTIGSWLFGEKPFPDPVKADLLWEQVQMVFRGEYQHLFKMFVKAEPHKIKKAQEGRWRLIMASSLPVQIAWHMTVEHLEEKTLEMTGTHPSTYGTTFVAGGWKRFLGRVRNFGLDLCIDKSAWDWNAPYWVFDVCRRLRERLTPNATPEWKQMLALLYDDAYVNSKIILPTGEVVLQQSPGLMKSGLVVTISDNSLAQVALHLLACKRLGMPPTRLLATGDDTIQKTMPEISKYIKTLEECGCVVKEYEHGVSFMGFHITDEGLEPMYKGKHLVNLSYQKDDYVCDTLDAYLRMYAHDEEMFAFWKRVSRELGYRLQSREFYLYFLNNADSIEVFDRPRPTFYDKTDGPGTNCV